VNVLDKMTSYKFVDGKLVARTTEELARLEQLKAEQAAREPAKKRLPRATERFVITTVAQAAKLFELEHVCWPLFTILLFENLRRWGQTFVLPRRQLNTVKGLSRANLQRALAQLEGCGLISVTRNPPRPPLITIL
jgi:hypothetical protein